LGVGFVPIRKPGKLPHDTHRHEYVLEYGSDSVEIHQDALSAGQRAVIIDDLLATGGTALATTKLVELCGADIHSLAFLVELQELRGRDRLHHYQIEALLQY
ncbi:MAG TPA: adenine phosphoribosyltransferase, partial [Dehalococcoidia bacterium]|nr:adenine phosphoribosyltransferase [Dehalococcoidia bacterium]